MLRFIEACSERLSIVASETFAARPGHSANFPVPAHHPQRMPAAFQNAEGALGIHRHRARVHQRRMRRFRAILRNAFLAVSGHGRYDARLELDRPNPAIVEIVLRLFPNVAGAVSVTGTIDSTSFDCAEPEVGP